MSMEKKTTHLETRHLRIGGVLLIGFLIAVIGGLSAWQTVSAQQVEQNQPIFPPGAPPSGNPLAADLPGPIPGMTGDLGLGVSGDAHGDQAEHIVAMLERPANLQVAPAAWSELGERLEKNSPMPIKLGNASGAPLAIANVSLKICKVEKDQLATDFENVTDSEPYLLQTQFTLQNHSTRRITRFLVALEDEQNHRHLSFLGYNLQIDPSATYYVGEPKLNLMPNALLPYKINGLTLRVAGVEYEDGIVWGDMPPPALPPPAPIAGATDAVKNLEQASSVQLQIAKQDGAPVTIAEARIRVTEIPTEAERSTARGVKSGFLFAPSLLLVNNTDKRIERCFISLTDAKRRSRFFFGGPLTSLAPYGSYYFDGRQQTPQAIGHTIVHPAVLTAEVLGVTFEDGSTWGDMPVPPPPPPIPGGKGNR